MSTTMAVTRNVPGRFRGFLSSCMLEVAPGVYVAPDMKRSVRTEIRDTLEKWLQFLPAEGGILLLWREKSEPSGLAIRSFGWPQRDLVNYEGIWLVNEDLRESHDRDELERLQDCHEEAEQDVPGELTHLQDQMTRQGLEQEP